MEVDSEPVPVASRQRSTRIKKVSSKPRKPRPATTATTEEVDIVTLDPPVTAPVPFVPGSIHGTPLAFDPALAGTLSTLYLE